MLKICNDINSLVLIFTFTSYAISLNNDVESPQCIYYGIEKCPVIHKKNQHCKCHKIKKENSLEYNVYCCNIKTNSDLNNSLACADFGHPQITGLHIRNATFKKLDANNHKWNNLESLSITDGNIQKINEKFKKDLKLTCLNLSNNGLNEVNPDFVQSLTKLSVLDLSHNNLTKVPNINTNISNINIDISGNPSLYCRNLTNSLLKYEARDSLNNINFLNQNKTYCFQSTYYNWFNSTDLIPFEEIEMLAKVDKHCPQGEGWKCACDLFRFVETEKLSENGTPRYSIKVDCSNRNLTSLPKLLPPFTVHLNVSNNQITQIDELSVDDSYNFIRFFFADHNKVKTFSVLEGSTFLDNFVYLSLKHNEIKSIPIYILSHAIDRVNTDFKELQLGDNHLICNCSTALLVKTWLLNNKKYVTDYDTIWCENVEVKVIDLDLNKICYDSDAKNKFKLIHFVIAIEIIILSAIIAKFTYDYRMVKRYGYLPWPASKLPKLPCDRIFE